MNTPIGINVIKDVIPLQASATKRDRSRGTVRTLPSRKTALPPPCRRRTPIVLTKSCSLTITGVTHEIGSGTIKSRGDEVTVRGVLDGAPDIGEREEPGNPDEREYANNHPFSSTQ
jgi:hypothetical protein